MEPGVENSHCVVRMGSSAGPCEGVSLESLGITCFYPFFFPHFLGLLPRNPYPFLCSLRFHFPILIIMLHPLGWLWAREEGLTPLQMPKEAGLLVSGQVFPDPEGGSLSVT